MRDHAVDIAAGDEERQPGLAKFAEIGVIAPIRLRQHRDGIAVRFQHTGDDRRTEAGMIDIGIAQQIDKIRLLDTALVQLGGGHG